jgi:hypothetical protein
LVAIVASQSLVGYSVAGASRATPALFTNASTAPNSASIRLAPASTDASDDTSIT